MTLEVGDKVKIKDGFNAVLTGKIGRLGKVKTEYIEIAQPIPSATTGTTAWSPTHTMQINYVYGIIFQELIPDGSDLDGLCVGKYGFWVPSTQVELIEKQGKNPFRKGDKVKIVNKADKYCGIIGCIENIRNAIGTRFIFVNGCGNNKYYIWELELIEKKIFNEKDLIL